MSMRRGTFSMNTGQAVSHQPQVVQAHTVSGFSTPPSAATSGGISVSSPVAPFHTKRPSSVFFAVASWPSWSQRKCLMAWFTALCVSGCAPIQKRDLSTLISVHALCRSSSRRPNAVITIASASHSASGWRASRSASSASAATK